DLMLGNPSTSEIRSLLHRAKRGLSNAPENELLVKFRTPPRNLPEEKGFQSVDRNFFDDHAVGQRAFRAVKRASGKSRWLGSARFFTAAIELAAGDTLGLARYCAIQHCGFELVLEGGRGD